jgi:hypothetical protein
MRLAITGTRLLLAAFVTLRLAGAAGAQLGDGCPVPGRYVGVLVWNDGSRGIIRTRQYDGSSHYSHGITGRMRCSGPGCRSRRGHTTLYSSSSPGWFNFRDARPGETSTICYMHLESLAAPAGCVRCKADFACNGFGFTPPRLDPDGSLEMISHRCRRELLR